MKKFFIYNFFPKIAGNISNWYKHIERVHYMGFNYLYINPFHYPGFSGSLYSPKDYYLFNELFFDSKEFDTGIKQLTDFINFCHEKDIKVIMDLVINHTAIDCDLIKEHPEWYVFENGEVMRPYALTESGEKIVWGDLAEIDNENSSDKENLWKYWLNMMNTYLNAGIDGFRCDAAYKVPADLWEYLISNCKSKYNDIVFMAETLGCTPKQTSAIVNAGFDLIFNSSKYWNYKENWLLKQYNQTRNIVPSISFPESHDTERLFNEVHSNINAFNSRFLFTTFFSTAIMIPIGFEFSFKNKLDVVSTKENDWEFIHNNNINLIKTSLDIKNRYSIFKEETFNEIIHHHNYNILIMKKTSPTNNKSALLILNTDPHNHQHVKIDNLNNILNSEHISDVSPEYPFELFSNCFEYSLRPGQMKLFVT